MPIAIRNGKASHALAGARQTRSKNTDEISWFPEDIGWRTSQERVHRAGQRLSNWQRKLYCRNPVSQFAVAGFSAPFIVWPAPRSLQLSPRPDLPNFPQ